MPDVYAWSDQHFFHKNVIKYAKRPFEWSDTGERECREFMIARCKKRVLCDDVVLFLGDVALLNSKNRAEFVDIIRSLPGFKILISGNHDAPSESFYKKAGFGLKCDFLAAGDLFFCHYPLGAACESSKERNLKKIFLDSGCRTLIHGHLHDRACTDADGVRRVNVCVDFAGNDYAPVKISDAVAAGRILDLKDSLSGEAQIRSTP